MGEVEAVQREAQWRESPGAVVPYPLAPVLSIGSGRAASSGDRGHVAPLGYYWRLGRRHLPGGVTWSVECSTCGAMRHSYDRRRDAARWLTSHRAAHHGLSVGEGRQPE
jgi:hypothetical protein